jgi:penicillin G amidase
MSTQTIAPIRRSRKLLRLSLLVVAAFAVLLVAASAWFYISARIALPRLDGSTRVPGLNSGVTVVRDGLGVPTIAAASLEDLFAAQGYVTAQDRLWQMDMTRRYASGRLSEVLGSRGLQSDIRQRTLLMPEIAANAAAAMPPCDRAYLEAYARGVNAYIDSHRHSLPVEFKVLNYAPQPWTVTDSLLVGASMSEMLNLETLDTALDREAITNKIGPELAADLYPNRSYRDHLPAPVADPAGDDTQATIGGAPSFSSSLADLHMPLPAPATELEALYPGSNDWVVSGAHTASGKPLLSNDMHLPHRIPNTWYEVHLTSGSFDVAGVSLPGVPFVIVGHNQRIAWGFTNIGPAVTDLYVETVNAHGEYLTPNGWSKLEHRHEHIRVHWGKDVDLDIPVTRHGPVVSSLIPGEKRPLALKWVLYDPATSQVPFFDVDSAQNWDEFCRAFSRFGSPGQSVVYADVDGHIGYHATGMIPLRPWTQQGSNPNGEPYLGLPLSGSDNSHEWAGYIPFDKLPTVFDPPNGIIATANGRITPDDYPYLISTEWGPPYRTERIYHFLNGKQGLTPADMLALQTDVYSDLDRFCAQRFVYAIDHTGDAPQKAKTAAEIMRNWDGRVTTDSAAATIVSASRRELTRLVLEPKLGGLYHDYRWFMSSVWLENTMLMQPPQWLPPNYPDYDTLFAAAVTKAVTESGVPSNLAGWKWGKVSKVYIQHPLFGSIPLLSHWSGPGRHPQSGNGFTVKQVGETFGPSERFTVDFANLDGSTLNILTGESGDIFSRHFMDQWGAWYNGTTFALPFSPAAVQNSAAHSLVLEPGK